MPNPYAAQAKSGNASKMKALTGKKSGGAVYSGEAPTAPKRATGGKVGEFKVGGKVSPPNFARGGRSKGKHHKGTHINIAVVAPHGKGMPDEAAGMPPPGMPPGMPPGGPPMAPPPGMAPPGAGGPPPGMPPMKRGGAVYADGGKVKSKNIYKPESQDEDGAKPWPEQRARGGATYAKGGKVPMTAGAGSGVGLLQKIKAYGKNARKQTSEE